MEWQHVGGDEWVFGAKVRGLVRSPQAWVEYVRPGWHWLVKDGNAGTEESLSLAVFRAEEALGVK